MIGWPMLLWLPVCLIGGAVTGMVVVALGWRFAVWAEGKRWQQALMRVFNRIAGER